MSKLRRILLFQFSAGPLQFGLKRALTFVLAASAGVACYKADRCG